MIMQVIISLGVMGIIAMTSLTLIQNQYKEVAVITERLAKAEAVFQILSAISKEETCNYIVSNFSIGTFNAKKMDSGKSTLSLSKLVVAASAQAPTIAELNVPISALTTRVVPKQIAFKMNSRSGNKFFADLVVQFDESKLTRAIRDIQIPITLETDPDTPDTKKTVTSCSGSSENSDQKSAIAYFTWNEKSSSLFKGDNIAVTKSGGKLLATFTKPQADAKYVVICNGAMHESTGAEMQLFAYNKTKNSFVIAGAHGPGADPIGAADCVVF